MSVTFLRDFQRDPARYVRQQLEALSAQQEQARKDARERELREARHTPEPPSAA